MSKAIRNMMGKKVDVVEEYDDVIRDTEVLLYQRPTEMYNTVDERFMHWELVFNFEDGSVRTATGVQEEDESLQACYTKESPRPDEKGKIYSMGKIKTSPKNVRELINANDCNGKLYSPTSLNCQDWVINIAKQLGDEISNKISQFKTLKDNVDAFVKFIIISANGMYKSVRKTSEPNQKMIKQ